MSIATVVTEGFGSFGTIGHVIRDGFDGSLVAPPAAPEEITPLPGGKGDNERRRRIVKPTGLPLKAKDVKEARKTVEERVEEAREVHREVLEDALETRAPLADLEETIVLTQPDLSGITDELARTAEIGRLLRKHLRTDEEEAMLVILLAADL